VRERLPVQTVSMRNAVGSGERGSVAATLRSVFALLGAASICLISATAQASTIVCGGAVRDEACKKVSGPLPADKPILFTLTCRAGGQADSDAAANYVNVAIDVSMLRLKSEGMELSGTFEEVDGRCTDPPGIVWPEDGQLFRYTGGLRAGASHGIHYPQTYSSGSPVIRFDVLMAKEKLDAAIDAAGSDNLKNTARSGSCAYGTSGGSGLALGTVAAAMALGLRRRRRR